VTVNLTLIQISMKLNGTACEVIQDSRDKRLQSLWNVHLEEA
jgi:hypothetical protein